jgi:plasmid stability protein
MAQLLIRGIDDDVLEAFRARARRLGRSQEQEARMLIEQAARAEGAWHKLARESERILRRLQRSGGDYGDSVEDLRADRNR